MSKAKNTADNTFISDRENQAPYKFPFGQHSSTQSHGALATSDINSTTNHLSSMEREQNHCDYHHAQGVRSSTPNSSLDVNLSSGSTSTSASTDISASPLKLAEEDNGATAPENGNDPWIQRLRQFQRLRRESCFEEMFGDADADPAFSSSSSSSSPSPPLAPPPPSPALPQQSEQPERGRTTVPDGAEDSPPPPPPPLPRHYVSLFIIIKLLFLVVLAYMFYRVLPRWTWRIDVAELSLTWAFVIIVAHTCGGLLVSILFDRPRPRPA